MNPMPVHGGSRLLGNYGRVLWACITGRLSVSLVLRGIVLRRYVQGWLARHPGRRFECRIPSGGRLLLDVDHWFIEQYYAGLAGFEPDLQKALKRFLRPGGTFVDCGANAGFYSVIANDVMRGTGIVVAIEANPALLPQLNANLEANGIGRSAVHAAITTHGGVVDFLAPARMDPVGGLRRTGYFGDEEVSRISVPAATLDDIIDAQRLDRVDVIKIDIEGGELDALMSAERTIARFRPILVVEYSSINWPEYGASPQDLHALCDKWNYRIGRYDVKRDEPVEVEPAFWRSEYANMILMPRETR
jgi:FkbM family methyltransferase